MKRILTFTIIMMALTACTALQVQTPEPAATDIPQVTMPNPASVYCEQKGNKLEIQTAADGSQNGICVFPDGSTCDEWAYFRGECGPAAQKSPTPAMTVAATTEASGGGPGGGNPGENGSGGYMPPGTSEKIADWWGVIKSTEPGAQYDDYFERQDLGQISTLASIQWTRRYKRRSRHYATAARSFIFMAHYSVMCLTTTGSQVQVDQIEIEG